MNHPQPEIQFPFEDGTGLTSPPTASQTGDPAEAIPVIPQRIELLAEQLEISKEKVETEEVIVRKEPITEMQTIEVSLTREELVVEYYPATADGLSEVPEVTRYLLSEEQFVIEKQTIIAEEILVSKRKIQRTEQVSEEVRHEELRVEGEDELA
ncbi:YsnF/AvaK domain-containing protein [Candidatus Cyanaurora vandensis]|uniref:YsnF/AvaK domain-containing protein n=1 Tax=Candidatus Cyanaurora vandensis TaxID=2714958 RepID=UPI00257B22DD|nr:YsnF/AvaK domain-containing protein [Candidatus Cyanaurora vandensis]